MKTVTFRCVHETIVGAPASNRERSCKRCRDEAKRAGKRGLALDGLMERIEDRSTSETQEEGTEMATARKTTARKAATKKTAAKRTAKPAAKRTRKAPKTVEHGARTRRKARATGSVVAVYNLEDAAAKPVGSDGKRLAVKADDSGKNWLAVCETHGSTKRYASWTASDEAAEPESFCAGCRKVLAAAE